IRPIAARPSRHQDDFREAAAAPAGREGGPMKQALKNIVKRTPFYRPLRNWWVRRRQIQEAEQWEAMGRVGPPPHAIKQRTLRLLADQYQLRVLVETGTFYGDMIEAMRKRFDAIYSIELSP